jgi:hypothetical protein
MCDVANMVPEHIYRNKNVDLEKYFDENQDFFFNQMSIM